MPRIEPLVVVFLPKASRIGLESRILCSIMPALSSEELDLRESKKKKTDFSGF